MKYYANKIRIADLCLFSEACVPVYTPKTFPDKAGLILSIKLTNLHRSQLDLRINYLFKTIQVHLLLYSNPYMPYRSLDVCIIMKELL